VRLITSRLRRVLELMGEEISKRREIGIELDFRGRVWLRLFQLLADLERSILRDQMTFETASVLLRKAALELF
jgi:hypothetical protein